MNPPIRVLIVDDQRMFREGIRSRLEQEPDIEVVGEAASGKEALALVAQSTPAIVLVDIRLPDMTGIELARALRRQWPELKILVLTGYDFDQYVRAMARVGIDGYMLKDSTQDALVEALHEIAAGGAVIPPDIASKVMRSYSALSSGARGWQLGDLTSREMDVVELMYQGLKNTEIADRLSISPRTVEAHVGNIISKLGALSRAEAVRIALQKNLIK
ncbi:MAG: response regulator transcription factor [Chloroflexi bacterium]|nr:response regulator transcription factor [Chloroflexota bacterium]